MYATIESTICWQRKLLAHPSNCHDGFVCSEPRYTAHVYQFLEVYPHVWILKKKKYYIMKELKLATRTHSPLGLHADLRYFRIIESIFAILFFTFTFYISNELLKFHYIFVWNYNYNMYERTNLLVECRFKIAAIQIIFLTRREVGSDQYTTYQLAFYVIWQDKI